MMKLDKNHPCNIKITRKEKAKLVNQCIEITYDSLKSHLPYTPKGTGKYKKVSGSAKFNRRTVKEYAWLIFMLSQLY